MATNRRLFKVGLSLVGGLIAVTVAVAWISSYRDPVYLRYGNGVGEVWCVLDRGLVQLEMNLGRHGASGWVLNDFSGKHLWGWYELQMVRPGWRARFGLSTWSYYLGPDSGVFGKPVHGRVIFFPLAPAVAAGIGSLFLLKTARRKIHHSATTATA